MKKSLLFVFLLSAGTFLIAQTSETAKRSYTFTLSSCQVDVIETASMRNLATESFYVVETDSILYVSMKKDEWNLYSIVEKNSRQVQHFKMWKDNERDQKYFFYQRSNYDFTKVERKIPVKFFTGGEVVLRVRYMSIFNDVLNETKFAMGISD